jgi:Flp pilus assembly protein CpaB
MGSMIMSSSPSGTDGPALDANGTSRPPRFTGRRIVTPRALPGGRALLGGLLIGVAMVAAVTLSRSVATPDTLPVVVAATAIRPGESLGPHNLLVRQLALPDDLVAGTYADPSALHGTVARSYVDAHEVVQRGSVIEASAAQRAAAPAREVSLRIDADRAVEGRLDAGDRVDVLATYGNGLDALTFVVLADAPVLSVARSEGGVTSSRSIVLTLALAHRADTVALAHAVDNADVTVVRTTTSGGSGHAILAPFRPTVEADPEEPAGGPR